MARTQESGATWKGAHRSAPPRRPRGAPRAPPGPTRRRRPFPLTARPDCHPEGARVRPERPGRAAASRCPRPAASRLRPPPAELSSRRSLASPPLASSHCRPQLPAPRAPARRGAARAATVARKWRRRSRGPRAPLGPGDHPAPEGAPRPAGPTGDPLTCRLPGPGRPGPSPRPGAPGAQRAVQHGRGAAGAARLPRRRRRAATGGRGRWRGRAPEEPPGGRAAPARACVWARPVACPCARRHIARGPTALPRPRLGQERPRFLHARLRGRRRCRGSWRRRRPSEAAALPAAWRLAGSAPPAARDRDLPSGQWPQIRRGRGRGRGQRRWLVQLASTP